MIKLKRILLEMPLNSFLKRKKDKFLKDYYKDVFYKNLHILQYAEHYKYEELAHKSNVDDIDIDEIIESGDFKKWLKYELEYKFDEIVSEILHDYSITGDEIDLYREMMVDDKWLKDLKQGNLKHVGVYWSYDEDSAEAHWGYGKGNQKILLHTKIDIDKIDWNETMWARMSIFLGDEEKEIRLYKGTPIKLESLYINGEEINIENLDKIRLVA